MHMVFRGATSQVIHGTSTLDMRKVDSARARILDINPHIHVEVRTVKWCSSGTFTHKTLVELIKVYTTDGSLHLEMHLAYYA
jgi:molybdopterin/thiamine biosynthesis adenylyltransferase